MTVPTHPKIYHIVHMDRLASIVADRLLWSDADMANRQGSGTTIGMSTIKARRLRLDVPCHPGLKVGQCTPFYFCSRSVMLYLIHMRNGELAYQGGQEPIVHLEADLQKAVEWAERHDLRWAFTLSNAGASYFEARDDLASLNDVNWAAVRARQWGGSGVSRTLKEGKQAEFLIERKFPWRLVERIGVFSRDVVPQVSRAIRGAAHRPLIEIKRDWYYP